MPGWRPKPIIETASGRYGRFQYVAPPTRAAPPASAGVMPVSASSQNESKKTFVFTILARFALFSARVHFSKVRARALFLFSLPMRSFFDSQLVGRMVRSNYESFPLALYKPGVNPPSISNTIASSTSRDSISSPVHTVDMTIIGGYEFVSSLLSECYFHVISKFKDLCSSDIISVTAIFSYCASLPASTIY